MARHLVDSRREDSRPLWRGTSACLLMAPYVKGSFLGQGRVPFLGQPSFNERSMWGANSGPIVPQRVISRVHVHLRRSPSPLQGARFSFPSCFLRPPTGAIPKPVPFPACESASQATEAVETLRKPVWRLHLAAFKGHVCADIDRKIRPGENQSIGFFLLPVLRSFLCSFKVPIRKIIHRLELRKYV